MNKINMKGGIKAIAAVVALVLVFAGVIGGTVAWLIAETDEVVNTFTYGDINLDLDETDTELDGDDDDKTNDYEMIPGGDIVKDPSITVKADSVKNWLFVKLDKSENFDDFLTYEMTGDWAQLYDENGAVVEGVFYLLHEQTNVDVVYGVLENNNVHVKEEVTKEMLNELDADPNSPGYPTLTVTAYAVQYLGFEFDAPEGVNAAALSAWQTVLANQNP